MRNFSKKFITSKWDKSSLSKINLVSQQNLYKELRTKSCHIEAKRVIEDKDKEEVDFLD